MEGILPEQDMHILRGFSIEFLAKLSNLNGFDKKANGQHESFGRLKMDRCKQLEQQKYPPDTKRVPPLVGRDSPTHSDF